MGIPDPDIDPQFYEGVVVRRFIAFILDSLVILGLSLILLVLTVIVSALTFGLALPIMGLALAGTGVFYRWIMLWQRSATLGMMATGIEVRDRHGQRCDNATAFLHSLTFVLTLYVLPLAIIGWFLMASSPQRRAMHDLMLQTVVINRPV